MPSFDRPDDPTIEISTWVQKFAGLIRRGGKVLDVACGHGRHARYLANLGYRVTAVDIDVSGITDLAQDSRLTVIAADLEDEPWPFANQVFDGIIVANYLHRPHFPRLIAALDKEGVLIFDTFGRGNEKLGRPRNPAFLLRPGELLTAFSSDLTIVAYEHTEETEPRPAVRQRLCAVRHSRDPTI